MGRKQYLDPKYREWQREYWRNPERREIRNGRARERYRERYQNDPEYRERVLRSWHKHREAEIEADYLNLMHLDSRCYLCSGPLGDKPHQEHVWPVSRFAEMPEGFTSALRLACERCNLGKGAKSPAAYVLERWRSGLPIVQAPTVTCDGCPVLALAA
jgi:5-methylcytosine-specific restriction endonuclease McrA